MRLRADIRCRGLYQDLRLDRECDNPRQRRGPSTRAFALAQDDNSNIVRRDDCVLAGQQIAKDKALALDGFSGNDVDGLAEHGAVVNKGMELAVLGAGICGCG